MNTDEATVNPDGSTTFQQQTPGGGDGATSDEEIPFDGAQEDTLKAVTKGGIDPAFFVLFAFFLFVGLYYYFAIRKKAEESEDDYFANLDGEKVWYYFISSFTLHYFPQAFPHLLLLPRSSENTSMPIV